MIPIDVESFVDSTCAVIDASTSTLFAVTFAGTPDEKLPSFGPM